MAFFFMGARDSQEERHLLFIGEGKTQNRSDSLLDKEMKGRERFVRGVALLRRVWHAII
jgi:hypothetical protein